MSPQMSHTLPIFGFFRRYVKISLRISPNFPQPCRSQNICGRYAAGWTFCCRHGIFPQGFPHHVENLVCGSPIVLHRPFVPFLRRLSIFGYSGRHWGDTTTSVRHFLYEVHKNMDVSLFLFNKTRVGGEFSTGCEKICGKGKIQ